MENKHISKGIYQHSQIGNFVSVKNYIFIRNNEKKQLMLRFSNDFDYVVDAMTYFVIQIDNFGKVLARTKITNKDLAFHPGTMYVTEQPICVDEYCSDFKIEFVEVVSGSYRYEVHSDMIAVHYLKAPEPIVDLSEMTKKEKRKCRDRSVDMYSVDQKDYQERGVAAFVISIVTIAVLLLNALYMLLVYIVSQDPAFIVDFPRFGEILDKIYVAFSSVSAKLNFLAYGETVILFAMAFFGLLFVFLTVNSVKNRKSAQKKEHFTKKKLR